MRVHAYIRVSTDEQAEEGFSLPTQRQRITDFCRSQWGLEPDLTWHVDDGFSAKDMHRPALETLRQAARPGEVVVVLRLDRLTRSVLDLYTLLREWEERGIFFRSVTEPYDTQKPEGRFMIGLLALLAEWERLRISERVREVMANTVREDRRHLSKPPFGYDLCAGQLTVNEAEAAVVREIFALYVGRGKGTRAIALLLNRRGLRTKQQALWSDFTVAYVLRNPVYTGQVAWQRASARGRRRSRRAGEPEPILVTGSHPPLVTPAEWAAAQARLEARRRPDTPRPTAAGQHPLTGLAVCGLCGAPVHGVLQRRYRNGAAVPGRERRYYRCSRREHQQACTLPYLPAEAVERRLLVALAPLATPDRLWDLIPPPLPQEARSDEAELNRCHRALRRWDEAYESEIISRDEWLERTAPLRRRRDELQTTISAPPPEPAPTPQDLPGRWSTLSPPDRKRLLQSLLTQVILHPDGTLTLTPGALV